MHRNGRPRTGLIAVLVALLALASCTSVSSRVGTSPLAPVSGGSSQASPPLGVSTAPATSSSVTSSAVPPDLTASALTIAVRGRVVTARTTIAASFDVTAAMVGVCARSSSGDDVDFPFERSAIVPTGGTSITSDEVLLPGQYSYWSCAKLGDQWHDIGAKKTFVVQAPVGLSGEPMPVGDLPGWRQTFTDDFLVPVAAGGFPGPYRDKWSGYNGFADTSGLGEYASRIISVHDGVLDMYLHSENGRPLGAAPVPLVDDGKWGGQLYGRYVIRFKSDYLPGYGTGWLLWPDSGNWNDGEIDFPEGSLAGNIEAFDHCIGNPRQKCLSAHTSSTYSQWHTATIIWQPHLLSFLLDGRIIGSSTKDIPSTPMRWTLQTATNGSAPAPATAGHLLIDWVAIYSPD